MKWFVMSFLVILASGCGLDEYANGYQRHPRVHVHPSRDYYQRGHSSRDYYQRGHPSRDYYQRGHYNRNESQHVEVPATPGHRGQPSQPEPSNYHGHDDGNQHGHGSVPGYANAAPPVQDTTTHNHP